MDTAKKLRTALDLHQRGLLADAGEIYKEILENDSSNVDALNLMGVILQAAGDLDASMALITRATELAPDYVAPYVNLGNAFQMDKRFDEAVDAFQKAVTLAPDSGEAANNLSSALNALERYEEALDAAAKALQHAPGLGAAHNNMGNALAGMGQAKAAIKCYEKAIAADAADATAHYNLGNALSDLGELEDALDAYKAALGFDDRNAEKFYNYANTALALDLFEEALSAFDSAITIDGSYIDAHCNRGATLQKMGRAEEAVASLQKALMLDPDSADLHWNLALALLQCGRYEAGWEEYEWRWQTPTFEEFKRDFGAPLWQGEDLDGKTILVDAEQGFGDALQFCRFVPALAGMGANVILETRPELGNLLDGLDGVAHRIDLGGALPAIDYHMPMMSLPRALGITLKNLPADAPYLSVPEGTPVDARIADGGELKVGFVWAGSPTRPDNDKRSCDVLDFEPLIDLPGVRFFSLQVGPFQDDLQDLETENEVIDLADDLGDFADTAAAIEALDLVMSVDTAVLHVAAALGKPVWGLMSQPTGFFWMDERTDSPWYPSIRLFRQPEPGDWDGVFEEVAAELKALLDERQG